MEMHNPAHPGEIVREECLKPLGLTVTAAAEALGVTRKTLSDLLNGHTGVSPDMAIRLEKVFGSTADTWLRMQMQCDLWEARQRADTIKVNRRFATAPRRASRKRGNNGSSSGRFSPFLVEGTCRQACQELYLALMVR